MNIRSIYQHIRAACLSILQMFFDPILFSSIHLRADKAKKKIKIKDLSYRVLLSKRSGEITMHIHTQPVKQLASTTDRNQIETKIAYYWGLFLWKRFRIAKHGPWHSSCGNSRHMHDGLLTVLYLIFAIEWIY